MFIIESNYLEARLAFLHCALAQVTGEMRCSGGTAAITKDEDSPSLGPCLLQDGDHISNAVMRQWQQCLRDITKACLHILHIFPYPFREPASSPRMK